MLLKLYDKNNNPQDLQRVTDILNDGGLIIYPTDTDVRHRMPRAEDVLLNGFAGSKILIRAKTTCLSSATI